MNEAEKLKSLFNSVSDDEFVISEAFLLDPPSLSSSFLAECSKMKEKLLLSSERPDRSKPDKNEDEDEGKDTEIGRDKTLSHLNDFENSFLWNSKEKVSPSSLEFLAFLFRLVSCIFFLFRSFFPSIHLEVKVIPVIHGTSKEAAWNIAKSGFMSLAKLDEGNYGQYVFFDDSDFFFLLHSSKGEFTFPRMPIMLLATVLSPLVEIRYLQTRTSKKAMMMMKRKRKKCLSSFWDSPFQVLFFFSFSLF